ncbi:MAG: cyclic lactone autoinducer peptide [Parasporobacterium sp.]|nr:cyclic lactone autoinducer peptide [Holdemanella sp.]MCF0228341.1 cyclic lactone autoinducer peptide [Parasporobacterium sp.]
MKKTVLKVLAKIAEHSIRVSNNTTCVGWTYQPKVPKGLKWFKK